MWERDSSQARTSMASLDSLADDLVANVRANRPVRCGAGSAPRAARPGRLRSGVGRRRESVDRGRHRVRAARPRPPSAPTVGLGKTHADGAEGRRGGVAEGCPTPQIADRLFISRRTVSTHLTHVFAKVGVTSRAELAAEATKRATESAVTQHGPRSFRKLNAHDIAAESTRPYQPPLSTGLRRGPTQPTR